MANAESIKKDRTEQQEKMSAIIRRIDIDQPDDTRVAVAARKLVQDRYPAPPFRAQSPGETARHHADYVAARLRLLTAMRREATAQDVEESYRLSLWSEDQEDAENFDHLLDGIDV